MSSHEPRRLCFQPLRLLGRNSLTQPRQVDEFICFDKWVQCIERDVSLLTLLSWRRLSGGDISVLGEAGKGTKHRKLKSTDKLSASYKQT